MPGGVTKTKSRARRKTNVVNVVHENTATHVINARGVAGYMVNLSVIGTLLFAMASLTNMWSTVQVGSLEYYQGLFYRCLCFVYGDNYEPQNKDMKEILTYMTVLRITSAVGYATLCVASAIYVFVGLINKNLSLFIMFISSVVTLLAQVGVIYLMYDVYFSDSGDAYSISLSFVVYILSVLITLSIILSTVLQFCSTERMPLTRKGTAVQ